MAAETLSDYITRRGISARAEYAPSNPNMSEPDDRWARDARHWLVTLELEGRTLPVPFSQGSAHTEEPTAEDVLSALLSDRSYLESEPESVDRRTAETIRRQSAGLESLLGSAEELEAVSCLESDR